jgi:O-antigen ligase
VTSKCCFLLGLLVFVGGGLRFVKWRIATVLTVGVLTIAGFDIAMGLRDSMISALHRDPTLTNRTDIWRELWSLRGNVLIGTGYEAFWGGDRFNKILEMRNINEAHNGYLEIFLNLGAIGLLLWLFLIAAAYKNCKRLIRTDYNFGQIAMSLFAVVVTYNLTEAGFRGLSPILFFFLLIAIDASGLRKTYEEEVPVYVEYPLTSDLEAGI